MALSRVKGGPSRPARGFGQAFGVRLPLPFGVLMVVQVPLGSSLNALPTTSANWVRSEMTRGLLSVLHNSHASRNTSCVLWRTRSALAI